ncbi:hypothetical protein [Anaerocolumna chitinilytica]|uniref:Uncharacterized protein n=1 Tax=Anaerocolumna chitinilytica TaxID=1727145 RepID=A0A7I8DP40_9FIRM|nr:hypothetical protein [Anaerocolumna chitinilytica]BCJ99041.1 hypothetical protein bsdcttw_20820 [Anaerocolumna chitinilytica]
MFDIKRFYAKCIQGNVFEAINYLKSFENKSKDMIELEEKYEHRFVLQDEILISDTDDPWIKDVVNCYYQYFIAVLTDKNAMEAEKALTGSLTELLSVDINMGMDDIEMKLEMIFQEKGYSFLGGMTMPFYGPYIWKTTRREDFLVELPCDKQEITLYFISDFLMISWLHFATFGRHYTGEWANEEGIYCVMNGKKEVDINSDDFQCSFLKHEAQHLSDYEKYPKIQGAELEYRAKLAELIYYPNTYHILENIILQAKDDESLTHPYASFLISKGLSEKIFGEALVLDLEKWKVIDNSIISENALNLYLENNQVLNQER